MMTITKTGAGIKEIDDKLLDLWVTQHKSPQYVMASPITIAEMEILLIGYCPKIAETTDRKYVNKYSAFDTVTVVENPDLPDGMFLFFDNLGGIPLC